VVWPKALTIPHSLLDCADEVIEYQNVYVWRQKSRFQSPHTRRPRCGCRNHMLRDVFRRQDWWWPGQSKAKPGKVGRYAL